MTAAIAAAGGLSLAAIVAVIAVCALGSFVQGSVGFGANLIAAPILVLVDDRFVPGPAIAASTLLTVLTLVRDRRGVHLGEIRYALIGRVPATILATITVALLPRRELAIVFAALVLVSVGLVAFGRGLRPNPRSLLVAGFASGYMGTATAIGGPPIAMLYANEPGERTRGTLAGFFVVGSAMSMVALVIAREFGIDEVRLTVVAVPGFLLGFLFSRWGARHLDAGRTRPAVLAVSALAAISVLLDAVW